jgi:hypothetical protein
MCVFCWEFVDRLYAGIDGFNVYVLLEFVERLYVEINGFQCVCSAGNLLTDYMLELMVSMCMFCWNLLKDYMLKLMVFNVCVLLEFVERLYAEIDGLQCVCSAGIC